MTLQHCGLGVNGCIFACQAKGLSEFDSHNPHQIFRLIYFRILQYLCKNKYYEMVKRGCRKSN
jgi:hypothetical protein